MVTYYVLFVIELAKRVVHIAGITTQPNESWMVQVARNLTDKFGGFLMGKSHLILDRDTKYTVQFRRLIAESKTAVIRLPPRSPNLNAFAERFVRSIKEECLDQMVLVAHERRPPKFFCRSLGDWQKLLAADGFRSEALPMSAGTPFANFFLIGRPT